MVINVTGQTRWMVILKVLRGGPREARELRRLAAAEIQGSHYRAAFLKFFYREMLGLQAHGLVEKREGKWYITPKGREFKGLVPEWSPEVP